MPSRASTCAAWARRPLAVLVGAVAVGVAAAILPVAAVTMAAGLLVAATVVPFVSWRLGRSAAGMAAAQGTLSAELVEMLRGAPELAACGREDATLARLAGLDRTVVRMSRRDGLASGVADGLGIAVAGLTVVGVLAVAAAARSRRHHRRRARGDARAPLSGVVRRGLTAAGGGPTALGDARRRPPGARHHRPRTAGSRPRRRSARPVGRGPRSRSTAWAHGTRPASRWSSTASASSWPPDGGSRSSVRAGPARRRS